MNDLLSPGDLVALIQIVSDLSNRLGCSSRDAIQHVRRLVAAAGNVRAPRSTADYAERVRATRLQRSETLRCSAIRDPAWDMLLDLYTNHARGRPSSTSSLCIGSGAPATTGLRFIDRLERSDLVVRQPDRRDNRRTLVELAPGVKERLETVLLKLQDCY